MASVFEHTYTLQENHIDTQGKAKPSALLGFALDAAGKHCLELEADWDTLAEQGIFWAVLRHRLQIDHYPAVGEQLTVKTWPMPTTRSAFPRAAVAYDRTGKEVFRLMSLWVLMDMTTRTMILPGKSNISVPGILQGNELEPPASIPPLAGEYTLRRAVAPEDLDRNNHMTNSRYLDWIDDLRQDVCRKYPVEIRICYLAEALPEQELQLELQVNEAGVLQVEGRRQQTDVPGKTTRIFASKLYF